MRTQKILDDGTYVFSNREQPNTHLHFELRTNKKNLFQYSEGDLIAVRGVVGFNASVQNGTHTEMLKYEKFIKAVSTKEDINITPIDPKKDISMREVYGLARKLKNNR